MIQDIEAFLNKLNTQMSSSVLDEELITNIIAQIDEMLQVTSSLTDANEINELKRIYEAYLLWVENSVNDCLAEKQRVADELVLLQRRKNAKEHYQR